MIARFVMPGQEKSGRSHYDLVILLNHDAYHRPGRLQSTRRNLVSRLEEAWASALGLSVDQVQGLVNITDNATCRIYRDVPGGKVDELPELFRRAIHSTPWSERDAG